MILADDELAGFFEEMNLVENKTHYGNKRNNSASEIPGTALGTRVKETERGKNQRDADRGEDNDLMKKFEGHRAQGFIEAGSLLL
jgi:hypothetical protein